MTLLRHRELGTFQTVSVASEAESVADVIKPPGYDDAMVTVWETDTLPTTGHSLRSANVPTQTGSRIHAFLMDSQRPRRSAINSARFRSSRPSRMLRSSGSARRYTPEVRALKVGRASAKVVQ